MLLSRHTRRQEIRRRVTGPSIGYVTTLQSRLSVSLFPAANGHGCNEIAEQATDEHAHEELDRW
jgi:hypothetical protein